jgi:hypothetical protein
MRKALICIMGLGVVLLWATSGAAHGRAFSGFGVGAPARSFIGVSHGRAFFHAGVGVPVHPGVVAPRVFVAPPGFVTLAPSGLGPRGGLVITPPIVIGPRALVTAPPVSMHVAPQTVVVLPPVRRAPPVFVTAPRARFVSPAVIVLTPQTTSGARTVGGLRR